VPDFDPDLKDFELQTISRIKSVLFEASQPARRLENGVINLVEYESLLK